MVCKQQARGFYLKNLFFENYAAQRDYPDLTVHLTLFHATIREGIPQKLEHNDIRWITVDEIDRYEFCPADKVILAKLKASK